MLVSGDPDFTTPAHIIDGAAAAAHAAPRATRRARASRRCARRSRPRSANGTASTRTSGRVRHHGRLRRPVQQPAGAARPRRRGAGAGPGLVQLRGHRARRCGPRPWATRWTRTRVRPRPGRARGAHHAAHARHPAQQAQQPHGHGGDRRRACGPCWTIAERHDLWVISDECYDQLVFDGRHVSTATLGDPRGWSPSSRSPRPMR